MDPEAVWEELTAAALLGTERRPFTIPTVPAPLDSIFAALSGREPEKALLGTAAALSLYRRAGRRPIKSDPTALEPAQVDDRPRCSAIADDHLALILAGTQELVLPEWLDILNELGQRPADETLPQLLELGRSKAEIRSKIVAAVGPLGAWLARQNPDWDYASGAGLEIAHLDDAAIDNLWQVETTAERAALLRRLRPSHPEKCRSLVASTWTTDGPDVRAKFLETFANGLTLDDEPFLEAALDDRRKEVRTAASDLLRRLPGSALVCRMIARVSPLLKLVENKPGELAIEATLPEACDKPMIRDGIESKFSSYLGLGEKANWLYQMVARIPPSTWSRAWSRTPAEIVAAVIRSEWNEALYPGLMEAALFFDDTEWNDALIARSLPAQTKANLFELVQAQPLDKREAMVLTMLRDLKPGESPGANLSAFLKQIPAPWGEDLSSLALAQSHFFTTMGNRYYLAETLGQIGLRVSTTVALATPPNLSFPIADPPAYLIEQVNSHFEHYQALIQFRHEMTQELRR